MLSGLSRCAGVVLAEKQVSRIKHIEFVSLDLKRALLVLAGDDGSVENRVLNLPEGLPPQALTEATNYLNARIRGATLPEARERVEAELKASQAELDLLTAKLVRAGLAQWSGGRDDNKSLIVRGQSRLLDDLKAVEDVERIRLLFEDLEFETGAASPARSFRKRRGRAHFHRFGEQSVLVIRVFPHRGPVPGSRPENRWRSRRDRADPA